MYLVPSYGPVLSVQISVLHIHISTRGIFFAGTSRSLVHPLLVRQGPVRRTGNTYTQYLIDECLFRTVAEGDENVTVIPFDQELELLFCRQFLPVVDMAGDQFLPETV